MIPQEIDKNVESRKSQEQKIKGLKEKIEERRKKIFFLDLQGYSNQEIANQTVVCLSTVEKDLHYMKYFCVKWYQDLIVYGSSTPLVESCSQIDIVQKELWNLYRKEKNASMKKRFLDSIVGNSIKKREFFKGYYGLTDSKEKLVKKLNKEIMKDPPENFYS